MQTIFTNHRKTPELAAKKHGKRESGLDRSNWAAWTQYLEKRCNRPSLCEILDSPRTAPLGWCLPQRAAESKPLIELLHESRKGRATTLRGESIAQTATCWLSPGPVDLDDGVAVTRPLSRQATPIDVQASSLDPLGESSDADAELSLAYDCLAWADAIPWLASAIPETTWNELLEAILQVAEQADLGRLDCPLAAQLLTGELPFRLAYGLPEIDACFALSAPANEMMSRAAIELLDDDGLPHASQLPIFRPLMASWTRCQLLATTTALGERARGRRNANAKRSSSARKAGAKELAGDSIQDSAFDKQGLIQYELGAAQILRLTRRDGGQILTDGPGGEWCEPFFQALFKLTGSEQQQAAARNILPRGKKLWPVERAKTKRSKTAAFSPSVCSEWAGLVNMRPEWKRNSPQWAACFHHQTLQTELIVGKQTLCRGDWPLAVTVDGRPLKPVSDWTEACWFKDSDVNYLELEIQLNGGWRVQRQLLLALEDDFLFVADAVLNEDRPSKESDTADIGYVGQLPILESIVFRRAKETRDGMLCGNENKPLANGLPLALPEWRIEKSIGELTNTVQGLQLEIHTTGAALYAPLFFDLSASRLKREPTWRRLTVARQLAIEPSDVAVAYRIETGSKQWLIYRSLAASANRTVLGLNLVSEFLCARFNRRGDAETIIEIE